MIDSHCHFDLSAFDDCREQVMQACEQAKLTRLLVPGLSIQQFPTIVALAKQFNVAANAYPHIDIALGLHPYYMGELSSQEQAVQHQALLDLAEQYHTDIVAIGECGLDANLAISMSYQQVILQQQIELAKQIKKPLVLHHRRSHNELIRLLKQNQFTYGGVIHAFSGSEHIANTYIDLGFKLGVGGTITYERAQKTRHTIAQTPLEHLLLETDAPDMPIAGYQGQINSPAKLPLIAKSLAQLKGCEASEVIAMTTANYHQVFYYQ